MNTKQQMIEELRSELSRGEELENIKDRSGEFVDSYLPIYYHEIVKEWQDMPGEYDDRGAQELGTDGSIGIIGLMSLDLYLYYTDIFYEAVKAVESEEVNA